LALIAKRILREVGVLNQAVRAWFLVIQKQVETVAKEQDAQNERTPTLPVVRPEINTSPPISTEQEAREARNEKRDKWKVRIEAATFLSVLAYAIINWNMLCKMTEANKTASDSFAKTLCQMQAQTKAQQDAANSVLSANRPWIVPRPPPHNKRTIQEANLEWYNAGKTPAVGVFSTAEYFVAEFPRKLRSCLELEKDIKRQPLGTWQYAAFVAQDGRYETGLQNTPPWNGPAPLNIHGCVWYTDILSNTERTTEFFYVAFYNRFGLPPSEGITLFYLQDQPFIYK
jgi:hypothetical protein